MMIRRGGLTVFVPLILFAVACGKQQDGAGGTATGGSSGAGTDTGGEPNGGSTNGGTSSGESGASTGGSAASSNGGGSQGGAPTGGNSTGGVSGTNARGGSSGSSADDCGGRVCGENQVCVRYTQICMPNPDGGPCPSGSTPTQCGESLMQGCIRAPCEMAPHCADMPASCGSSPNCGCGSSVCSPRPCTSYSAERREFACVCP